MIRKFHVDINRIVVIRITVIIVRNILILKNVDEEHLAIQRMGEQLVVTEVDAVIRKTVIIVRNIPILMNLNRKILLMQEINEYHVVMEIDAVIRKIPTTVRNTLIPNQFVSLEFPL